MTAVDEAGRITVVNPATEEVVSTLPCGGAAEIDRAVAAAGAAFESWATTEPAERCAVLDRFAALYAAELEQTAQVITMEMGAPIQVSRAVHAGVSGQVIADTVRIAREFEYESRAGDSLLRREPYGVVGAITPWNNPLYMMFLKAMPALAAGCTVVHKPSELSPLSAQRMAGLLERAGLPDGVYNLVVGAAEAGAALSAHPGVDVLSFTGSTGAGRKVAAAAADTVTPATLELGGKSAAVILEDADLDQAVSEGLRSAFNNAGQMCGAWTRMVVPRRLMGEITERAVAGVGEFVVGDPLDEKTTMGPLVSAAQRARVLGFIRAGIEEGATPAIGGLGAPPGLERGFYVRPTVFTNVDNSMTIAQQEIFGPVLSIIAHDGDEDAVRIANDSDYGLRGAVFSADPDRALAVARRMRTGQVDINGYKLTIDIPFGGYKQSGYGRCQGVMGFEEYLQIKSIQL
ncbi:aldehyde dehydrogenase family protein [Nocardia sp. NPDC051030]|uniref:aldehyde dehydrogenase family protein n=1 Tax=Nocardia sp. NPDC051030 TaxID=3155162 RepID=UPI003427C95A